MLLRIVVVACSFGFAGFRPASAGELKLPWASPAARVSQTIGVTDIAIEYHRPALKGRDLAKDLALLEASKQVWRFGANDATRLVTSDPITIGDTTIPAGEFGLYALPAADEWTVIVSRQSMNWGSYGYDPKQDVTRIYVKPTTVAENVEWLAFAIEPTSAKTASLRFSWGTTRLEIPIEVDVDATVAARIEAAIESLDAKDWDTRLAIAKYWCQRKEHLDRALALSDEALTIQRHFWTCEWKARILDALGRRAEAKPLLAEAITLSKGKTPIEYQKALEAQLAEWE